MSAQNNHQYFRKPPEVDKELEHLVQFLLKEVPGSATVHVVTQVERGVAQAVIQNGPMCGLVALTMASSLLQGEETAEMTSDEVHPEVLLQLAKERGVSKNGEIFAVEFLRNLAKEQLRNCTAEVVSLELVDVLDIVLNSKALLVPYDADKDHTPCLEKGHKAHWCLVVGIAVALPADSNHSDILDCCIPNTSLPGHFVVREEKKESFLAHIQSTLTSSSLARLYVFARHGKSSHMGLWKFSDLLESNRNLVEVDPKRTVPGEYVIPEGGIRESLCGKALLILKK